MTFTIKELAEKIHEAKQDKTSCIEEAKIAMELLRGDQSPDSYKEKLTKYNLLMNRIEYLNGKLDGYQEISILLSFP